MQSDGTIPKEIYELAMKQGWEPAIDLIQWEINALDRDFWQALGKGLGWGLILEKDGEKIWDEDRKKSTESENAHRFFDLVLTNGDLDTFWNELSIN